MQYETNVIQSTNGTLNNSAFIKTNLMIMVIICHSAAFWTGNWFTRNPVLISVPISMLSSWLGSCHTYSFTLVSGYLFANRVYGGGYIRYLPYLWNKTKRLLIPYFFSMIVWVAPLSNYYFHWSIQTLIKKYIFCIDPSQLWFLWMLFGIFVIVWPLKEIIMMNPIIGYMISLILYFIGIVGKIFILNVFCFLTAFQYFVFFYLGMRIRIDEENKRRNVIKRIPWYSWVLADVLLFILLQMIYTKEVGGGVEISKNIY